MRVNKKQYPVIYLYLSSPVSQPVMMTNKVHYLCSPLMAASEMSVLLACVYLTVSIDKDNL